MNRHDALTVLHGARAIATAKACLIVVAVVAAILPIHGGGTVRPSQTARSIDYMTSTRTNTHAVTRGTFINSIRLNGFIEAVTFTSVMAPSITGKTDQQLVIQKLASNGVTVKRGDPLVDFDREQQLRVGREMEAQWLERDTQVRQKRAERETQAAKDQAEVDAAEVALETARLECLKNELLPRVEAQKNELSLRSAQETLSALREWIERKRAADRAAIRVLEVRRNRSELLMRQAQRNADGMAIRASIDGLVVLKTKWRNGGVTAQVEEGQSLWSGSAVMDLIGPGDMRVRASVSDIDAAQLRVGQKASVRLDSHLDKAYPAYLETISPVAVRTGLSSNARSLTAVFRIETTDSALAPDVSAAVDVELKRREDVLVAPRDALVMRGERTFLSIQGPVGPELQPVTIGGMNDMHVIISSGVDAGKLVLAVGRPPVSSPALTTDGS